MPIYLHALALQNYKGIGPQIQKMSPFREFNFFIGANNAGKSTVLEFLSKYLLSIRRPSQHLPLGLERYTGEKTGEPFMAIGIPTNQFVEAIKSSTKIQATSYDLVERIATLLSEESVVWIAIPFGDTQNRSYMKTRTPTDFRKDGIDNHTMSTLWQALTNKLGGTFTQDWVPETLSTLLAKQRITYPEVNCDKTSGTIGESIF
jgi:hypothetical protein